MKKQTKLNNLTWNKVIPCVCGLTCVNYLDTVERLKKNKCVHFLRPPEFWGCTKEDCNFRTQFLPNIMIHEMQCGTDKFNPKIKWQQEESINE